MRKLRNMFLTGMTVLFFVPGAALFAQYDITDALGDVDEIAAAVNSIFGPNLGGMSYVGDPVGYSIIPHGAIGISAGATFVPLSNINTGTFMKVNFADMGSLAYFPIPAVGAHAKFTIKKKFELGVKVAGIPEISDKDAGVAVHNLIIGGKLRYNLVGFKLPMLKGGVSVGAHYEYMSGGLMMTESGTIPIDVDNNGTTDGTFATTAGFETMWKSGTFGGEVQANAQVLFLNFFAGSRVSTTVGKSTTTMNGTGTLTDSGGGLVVPGVTTVNTSQTVNPTGLDPYVFGGLELKILGLVISGKLTYNIRNQNYVLDNGLRLQF
jgi:hypothetical protein